MTLARLSNQTEVQLIDDLHWYVQEIIDRLENKGYVKNHLKERYWRFEYLNLAF